MALDLAKKVDADVVLANDPDADRLGIYAKDSRSGEYKDFTGNMSALLIAEYRISQMKEKGILPENGMFISTVVSSNLAKAIAKEYNLDFREVLTGFKNIGEQIKIEEQKENGKKYLFGFEESYGCLIADYARDKDAISAVMSLCEAASYYKSKGLTLWDQMINIYEKYGYYKEGLATLELKGVEGAAEIQNKMNNFRQNPPKELGGFKVLAVRDYKADERVDFVTGEKSSTGLPSSNVLYYELEDNAWCCVRPSGTEPKIKFYTEVKDNTMKCAGCYERCTKAANEKIELIKKDLGL
jgi:phosphoglucomutase